MTNLIASTWKPREVIFLWLVPLIVIGLSFILNVGGNSSDPLNSLEVGLFIYLGAPLYYFAVAIYLIIASHGISESERESSETAKATYQKMRYYAAISGFIAVAWFGGFIYLLNK